MRADLMAGRWAPGERIGSNRNLQQRFKVSEIVIRGAMDRLKDEGLVETRRGGVEAGDRHQGGGAGGGGYYAARRPVIRRVAADDYRRVPGGLPTDYASGPYSASLVDSGRPAGRCPYRTFRVSAAPHIAARLGVPGGTPLIEIHYTFIDADGLVTHISVSHELVELAGSTSAEIRGEADDLLGCDVISRYDGINVRAKLGREVLQARPATDEEAAALQVGDGTTVVSLIRVHVDETGRPFETSETVFVGYRYVFEYEVPVTEGVAPPRPAEQ